jgi:hypothetical protein
MAADPLTVAAFVAGPLVTFGLYGDSAPPQNYFAGMTQVERLYRDGERIVSTPILDVSAADAACPNGNQVVRQSSRVDGSREYLVWTLRCR